MHKRIKANEIAYIDSSDMRAYSKKKSYQFEADQDKTPIEIWLERVKRNLVTVRKVYFSQREPKYLYPRNNRTFTNTSVDE